MKKVYVEWGNFTYKLGYKRKVRKGICQYIGLSISNEPKNFFKVINENKKDRPDGVIVMPDNPIQNTKYVYDISIVSTLTVKFDGRLDTKGVVGYPARHMAEEKHKHYDGICASFPSDEKLKFVPIIMETSGLIHGESFKFLEKLAEVGEKRRKISKKVLLNYFMKLLNTCMMKNLSSNVYENSLNQYTHAAYSTVLRETELAQVDEVVRSIDYVC